MDCKLAEAEVLRSFSCLFSILRCSESSVSVNGLCMGIIGFPEAMILVGAGWSFDMFTFDSLHRGVFLVSDVFCDKLSNTHPTCLSFFPSMNQGFSGTW